MSGDQKQEHSFAYIAIQLQEGPCSQVLPEQGESSSERDLAGKSGLQDQRNSWTDQAEEGPVLPPETVQPWKDTSKEEAAEDVKHRPTSDGAEKCHRNSEQGDHEITVGIQWAG